MYDTSGTSNAAYMRDPAAAIRLRKYAMAQALQRAGTDTSPVVGTGNNTPQALARVLQAGVGAFLTHRMEGEAQEAHDRQRAEDRAELQSILAAAGIGGGAAPQAPAEASAPPVEAPAPQQAAAPPPGAPAPVPAVGQSSLTGPGGRPIAPPPGTPEVPPEVLTMTPEQLAARSASTVAGRSGMPVGPSYRSPEGVDGVFAGLPPPNGGIPAIRPGGGAPTQALAAALAAPGGAAPAAPTMDPARMQSAALAAALARSPNAQRVAPLLASLAGSARSDQRYEQERSDRTAAQRAAAQRAAVGDARSEEQLRLARAAAARDEANQPVERVRQADGSERIVPRREAVGMASAAPAVDTFGRANTLRDEYRALTGDFRTVQTAYQNIQGASRSNTGAGDMSMLYSYVKMLDPGSVVRESEFATAAASGSFGERIQGAVQRIISGERLPESLRQSFVSEARNLHSTQRRTYDHLSQQYRSLAERNSLRPDDVVTDFITPDAAPVRVQSPDEAQRLPSGTPILLPDGTQGRVP